MLFAYFIYINLDFLQYLDLELNVMYIDFKKAKNINLEYDIVEYSLGFK